MNTEKLNKVISGPFPTAGAFYAQQKKTGMMSPAESRAMFAWFKHLTIPQALAMAVRHGGRYLIINGGKCNG